ncbi:hypothetical protein K8T06_01875, partial [bacterium]|nr:hypothetical protein [bacterium]
DSRDQQGKYRMQLFKLKSNREYQALNKEIELLDKKISESETDIIERMESIDNAEIEQKEAEIYLKKEETRVGLQKATVEKELKEETRRLIEAETVYSKEHGNLDESLRDNFDRLVRKNSRGVAELNGRNCGNCFVKVRPQIAASAMGNTEILTCDTCGVYLYSREKTD